MLKQCTQQALSVSPHRPQLPIPAHAASTQDLQLKNHHLKEQAVRAGLKSSHKSTADVS